MAAKADDTTRTFVGLKDLTDATKLSTKRVEVEQLRGMLRRDWALNRSFYNGAQWSFWNPQMVRVEDLPIDSGPKWKVRLTSNQIKPGLASYVAQLTKTRPVITAEPDSGSDQDVKSAQMAEALFEYLWEDKHLNAKCQDALIEAGLSGGYWNISWDSLAGKPMTFTIGPDGQPIIDDELATAFLDEFGKVLEQTGHDPEMAADMAKKTVYLGDINIEVMSIENVLLDPACSRFEDATWAICRHALDPDEIKARWGVQVEPSSYRSSEVPIPYVQDRRPPNTLREVFIGYFRPSPALPKGRYVAWIEGPNQILQDMDWPYPFNDLPLVKFPGIYRPNSPYDDALVTDIRPLQKDLNKTLSQIVEHKNLTVRPQMLAPIGSLRQKLTSEPGAVFEYNPVGNAVPQWREMPSIPTYVFEHLADLQQRIDRAFNRIPSTREQIPARADSGGLLEGMMEAVSDQLSPVIIGIEDALARAGHLMAAFAQEYYEEPRLIRIRGVGGSIQVKKFMASDIAGGFSFKPRYGTGLPRSRAGKQQAIMEMMDRGLINPKDALKHLDLADVKGVGDRMARSEDHALREHDKIRRGQAINPAAVPQAQQQLQEFMQQAQATMQALQAGQQIDMDGDGQPDDPQQVQQQLQQQYQQLQQAVQDAPWQPLEYEDVFEHVPVHMDFMRTIEFEGYPPEMQQIFITHLNASFQMMQQQMWMHADPKNAPKVTINARATTSAKVMAQVLANAGIPTTEQEVAEPPLETAVFDMVDQPSAKDEGNEHMDQHAIMMAQDAHELAQAQTAQAMMDAKASAATAQAKSVQQLGLNEVQATNQSDQHATQQAQANLDALHKQQLHEQAVRHAEELHKAKLKKANEPTPKPAKAK